MSLTWTMKAARKCTLEFLKERSLLLKYSKRSPGLRGSQVTKHLEVPILFSLMANGTGQSLLLDKQISQDRF